MSAASSFAQRLGTHAAIYTTAPVFTFAASLANVVILTRFLAPSEYGQLGVLLVFSSMLTIVFNLGSLQGTFRVGFGATGEEGEEVEGEESTSDAKRRAAIGTGIAITLLVSVVGVVVLLPFAGLLANLLGAATTRLAFVWAVVGGGLGSVWRLVSNLLRLERRPVAYIFVHGSRPLLSLAGAAPLVATGYGVTGALAGYAIGTAASLGAGLALARSSFRPVFQLESVPAIFRLGAPLVPVTLGFWTIENSDIFLLAWLAGTQEVGLYRVSARVGGLVAYVASSYLMAWGPIVREPIYLAAEREHGRTALDRMLITYFVTAVLSVVLTTAVFAHYIVGIAAAGYAGAAPLMALLGLRWGTKSFFQSLYRTATYATKQRTFVYLVIASAVFFLALSIVLIPIWGAVGAAVAASLSPMLGAVGMRWSARRRGEPSPLDYRRIFGALALAGACWILSQLTAGFGARPATDTFAIVAFVALLVVTGIVPWRHITAITAAIKPRGGPVMPTPPELDPVDAEIVERAAGKGFSISALSTQLELPEGMIYERLVAALRLFSGITASTTKHDRELGELLCWKGSQAEKDYRVRQLWSGDADPMELDALSRELHRLRRGRGRRHLSLRSVEEVTEPKMDIR